MNESTGALSFTGHPQPINTTVTVSNKSSPSEVGAAMVRVTVEDTSPPTITVSPKMATLTKSSPVGSLVAMVNVAGQGTPKILYGDCVSLNIHVLVHVYVHSEVHVHFEYTCTCNYGNIG